MDAELHAEMNACREAVERDLTKVIDDHIEAEAAKYEQIHKQLTEVQQQLSEITKLFEQGKGALTVLKWAGYVVAGAWAALLWGKDHLKL